MQMVDPNGFIQSSELFLTEKVYNSGKTGKEVNATLMNDIRITAPSDKKNNAPFFDTFYGM